MAIKTIFYENLPSMKAFSKERIKKSLDIQGPDLAACWNDADKGTFEPRRLESGDTSGYEYHSWSVQIAWTSEK